MSRLLIMTKKRSISYIIYSLIAVAIFAVPGFFRLLTDWYWFQEIGFSNIFTTILGAKILLGVGVGIFSFFIIYGNFWLARRLVASKPSGVTSLTGDSVSPKPWVKVRRSLIKLRWGRLAVFSSRGESKT